MRIFILFLLSISISLLGCSKQQTEGEARYERCMARAEEKFDACMDGVGGDALRELNCTSRQFDNTVNCTKALAEFNRNNKKGS